MDLELFQDHKYIEENDLSCAICQYVMEDAVCIVDCQHSFCKKCLTEWRESANICPICRSSIEKFIPDRRAKKQLAVTVVKCKRYKQGCNATGPLGDGGTRFWEKHELVCSLAPAKCRHCKTEIKGGENSRAEHESACDQRPIDCPFKSCGCNVQLPEKKLKQHLNRGIEHHYFLMAKKLNELDTSKEVCLKATGVLDPRGVTCNGCKVTPIFGTVYTCRTCDKFNFCALCISVQEHDAAHLFKRVVPSAEADAKDTDDVLMENIEAKADNPPENRDHSVTVHLGVHCDSCGQADFSGDRFMCLLCDDFDLCTNCRMQTVGAHSPQHPMVLLSESFRSLHRNLHFSKRPEVASRIIAKCGSSLIDLEANVPWSAVEDQFRGMRDRWVSDVGRANSAAEISSVVTAFAGAMRSQSWKENLSTERVLQIMGLLSNKYEGENRAIVMVLALDNLINWRQGNSGHISARTPWRQTLLQTLRPSESN